MMVVLIAIVLTQGGGGRDDCLTDSRESLFGKYEQTWNGDEQCLEGSQPTNWPCRS